MIQDCNQKYGATMERLGLFSVPENTTEKLAQFLTIVGVDSTFLAVRAAIRQIVLRFS
jgi:hypothetical protein